MFTSRKPFLVRQEEDQVEIGVPFNPYRVFQGAFAPFWLLEHQRLEPGQSSATFACLGSLARTVTATRRSKRLERASACLNGRLEFTSGNCKPRG